MFIDLFIVMKSFKQILVETCFDDRLKDTIKGGLADKYDPGKFNQKELMKGIHVELEHTKDILQAMEIAMDHLTEDPEYYEKLSSIESEGRKETNLKKVWDRVWKGRQ